MNKLRAIARASKVVGEENSSDKSLRLSSQRAVKK
jgi:hypothetical protein